MEKYKKLDTEYFLLDDCIKQLLKYKELGVLAYIEFRGHKLYSDTVTWDSAYIEVHGMSYKECKKMSREWDNIFTK